MCASMTIKILESLYYFVQGCAYPLRIKMNGKKEKINSAMPTEQTDHKVFFNYINSASDHLRDFWVLQTLLSCLNVNPLWNKDELFLVFLFVLSGDGWSCSSWCMLRVFPQHQSQNKCLFECLRSGSCYSSATPRHQILGATTEILSEVTETERWE